MTGNGNYVNQVQVQLFLAGFRDLKSLCAAAATAAPPPRCSRATSSTFTEKEKASIENKSILDQEPSQTSFPEK